MSCRDRRTCMRCTGGRYRCTCMRCRDGCTCMRCRDGCTCMRRRGGRDCQFSEAASCRGVHWVARAEASKQLDALGSREQRCTSRACISRRTAPHHVATDQPRHAFAVSPPFAVASFRALICVFVFGMSAIMRTAVPSKTPVPTNTNVLTRTTATTTMHREIVRRSLHDRSKHCP